MDSGTIRLAVIAVGILAGVGVAYLGLSMFHHRGGEVPVIQADERPIRVKPENPGGLQIAGAGSDIFSGGSDTNGSKLAPAPEAPNPQALRAQAPAAQVPASAQPEPAATVATASPAAARPVVAPLVRTPVAAPLVHAPVAAKPTAQPAAHGKAGIQLAAVGSEADARAEWQRLQKRYPEVLSGRQLSIGKTELNGKIFWRVRTSGFPDLAQAKSACEKVKAKGGGCSAAAF